MSMIRRRTALLGLTTALTVGPFSLALAQAETDKIFVVIILRGALDGLAAVVPHGDPNLATWRAGLIPPPNAPDALLDMGGFFGLHPALKGMHALYAAGECLPVHAVAGGAYRTRSHFDAQDLLECGADRRMESGWLNRVVGNLPARKTPAGEALAVGSNIPLLLRGPQMVDNFTGPDGAERPAPDLYARIAALNATDPLTGPVVAEGLRGRDFAATTLGDLHPAGGVPVNRFATLAAAAGKMLAASDGPRVAALELGGWDTHADQMHHLAAPLAQLDGGLVALKAGLGEAWLRSVVLVMTEFGRTVRINGTKGTDHGTAGVAFVLGGRVNGGRIGGVWPGLAQSALFENRDLAPTTDLRSVAKGILGTHLGMSQGPLADIFPGSVTAGAMGGLLRA
jgi:uncharacterized protein (DUF1501 family)